MSNPSNDAAAGNSPVNSAFVLLQEMKVRSTKTALAASLQSHPYFPSLLSISETLRHWGVDTLALTIDAGDLGKIPCPFLAHSLSDHEPFLVVTGVKDDGAISFRDGRGRDRHVSTDEFVRMWDGHVLAVEKGEASGEPGYHENVRREWWQKSRFPLLATTFLLLVLTGLLGLPDRSRTERVFLYILYAGNVAGMVTSVLLMWFEYDQGNPFLRKICGVHSRTDCGAVLGSQASRLWGTITWAELGFIYFSGALLYTALDPAWPLLAAINALAAFYIPFSLLYQGFIVKKWCVLCLFVQFILLGEVLAAWGTDRYSAALFPSLAAMHYFLPVLSWFIPAACWIALKPHWYAARDGASTARALARLKANEVVFRDLLQQQPVLHQDPRMTGLGIGLGDPAAPNTLVVVSGPLCTACAIEYRKMEKLLQQKEKWRATLIFTFPKEDLDAAIAAAYFVQLSATANDGDLRRSLREWFAGVEKGRYTALLGNFRQIQVSAFSTPNTPISPNSTGKALSAMNQWSITEEIRYTPAVYINGRRMPSLYDLEDLELLNGF